MATTSPASTGSTTPSVPPMPELRIVPSRALLLHEESDPLRVERLTQVLAADGVLRNPPVAAPLGRGEYVVLDGANRVTALARAGYPDQLVQVVDYDDEAVALEVWAHLLSDGALLPSGGAWEALPAEAVHAGLHAGTLACGVITPAGACGLRGPRDLAGRIVAVGDVVGHYVGRAQIYRVPPAPLEALAQEYGQVGGLVVFPRLTKPDIREIARLPVKLPSGISRHIVQNRALRVNVDLALLRSDMPTSDKQARLDAMIRDRLARHRVRRYPESTVLFDD